MSLDQSISCEDLADTLPMIERILPTRKISAEAQYEVDSGSPGRWIGASCCEDRKPLVVVRTLILATLLPATDDVEADLRVFDKLMGIDDESLLRRGCAIPVEDLIEMLGINNPHDYFYADEVNPHVTIKNPHAGSPGEPDEVTAYKLPDRSSGDHSDLVLRALSTLPYDERIRWCKRLEESDADRLYGPIWEEVNNHLRRFGIEAFDFPDLIHQLGARRYGHTPRVGDSFAGSGSVPYEAARMGCEAYASDSNPVACMLTWFAANIIGSKSEEDRVRQAILPVDSAIKTVKRGIDRLGLERSERGDRAVSFLYCIETFCPKTGWMVPLAESWVISEKDCVVTALIPDPERKRYDFEVIANASDDQIQAARAGTIEDDELVHVLGDRTHRTPLDVICEEPASTSSIPSSNLRR